LREGIWIIGCSYPYRVVCFVLDFNSMLLLTGLSFETFYMSRWIRFGISSIYSREVFGKCGHFKFHV